MFNARSHFAPLALAAAAVLAAEIATAEQIRLDVAVSSPVMRVRSNICSIATLAGRLVSTRCPPG